MTNEILFFITTLIAFVGSLLSFYFWGRKGVYAWIAFSSIVVNIEVIKCVDIFGLSVTLGNVLYGSTFLCTDILSENYGGKESRKAVRVGFFYQLLFTAMTFLSVMFIPNAQDFSSEAFKTIFTLTPRICFASFTAFFISNTFDTYLYDWIARKTKKIWIRNNLSTMTSQMVDTLLFTFIAFYGLFDWGMLTELALTTYLIKILVALCDTPFAYIGKYIYQKRKDKWLED